MKEPREIIEQDDGKYTPFILDPTEKKHLQ